MKKKSSIVLVILWMVFIFVMSSFTAGESAKQSGRIVRFIATILNTNNLRLISHIIRKTAHFIEYFILGLFVSNMFNKYNKLIYFGIIVCTIYAISDELHQLLVPGRSCQIGDILIDSMGAILGVILYKKHHR